MNEDQNLIIDVADSKHNTEITLAAPDEVFIAAGATAPPAGYAAHFANFRLECHHWADQMNQGMWPLMTPEQKKLALLYYDTHFWNAKLALVEWAPYGLLAVPLSLGMIDRLRKDLQMSAKWVDWRLEKNPPEDVWESMHGAQTQRYDSKVIRLISTVGLFALGAASVATGGIGSSAFLAKFAVLLDSTAFGSSALGIMAGGTYFGVAGQQSSKHGLGLWHKLRSGLPLKVIRQLAREEEKEICAKLSLYYFSSHYLSWLNKIRIRLATGDSYLPAKAWVADDKENENRIHVEGKYYRVDRRLHTYRGTGAFLGLVAGALLGYFFLGPIGAIVLGYIGYRLGRAIGAWASYHQSPYDNPIQAQDINQAVYEHLEHIKYEILKQNPITHLYKNYYNRAFENIKNPFEAFFGATFALFLDSLKLLLTWPLTVLKNAWQYFSPKLALIQRNIQVLNDRYNYAIADDTMGKFVLRVVKEAFLSVIIGLLKLPNAILGAVFAIINPFGQTEYFKEKQQLEHEKRRLKTELNRQTLFPESEDEHIERYYDYINEYKRPIAGDKPVSPCFEQLRNRWKSTMSFFGVAPSERETKALENYQSNMEEIMPAWNVPQAH